MESTNPNIPLKWYNKKWLVIVLCIFVFPVGLFALWNSEVFSKQWKIGITVIISAWLIIAFANKEDKPKGAAAPLKSQNATDTSKEVQHIDLTTRLSNAIKSIDSSKDFATSKDVSTIKTSVLIFSAYGTILKEGQYSKDPEDVKLTKTLESKLVAFQKLNFPKLRKQYCEYIRTVLWENDIDVTISGTGNSIMTLIGHHFATNKNIKESQEALSEMVNILRFKQVRYQWYKGQDDYEYYGLETPKDSEIKISYE